MITNIVFDYNGIFGPDSDDWNSYREFVSKTGLSDRQLSDIWNNYWPTISTGKQKLIDFLKEISGKSPNNITSEELLKTYLDNMTVYDDVLNFAKELKASGYKIFILSNETKEAQDYKVDKFKLQQIFSKIYCSADIGMTKRNPDAFKILVNNEKLNPEETLFIDDREHNVAMARTFGMKGIFYKNLKQLKEEIKQYID